MAIGVGLLATLTGCLEPMNSAAMDGGRVIQPTASIQLRGLEARTYEPAGFSIGVPDGWRQVRPPAGLTTDDDVRVVAFERGVQRRSMLWIAGFAADTYDQFRTALGGGRAAALRGLVEGLKASLTASADEGTLQFESATAWAGPSIATGWRVPVVGDLSLYGFPNAVAALIVAVSDEGCLYVHVALGDDAAARDRAEALLRTVRYQRIPPPTPLVIEEPATTSVNQGSADAAGSPEAETAAPVVVVPEPTPPLDSDEAADAEEDADTKNTGAALGELLGLEGPATEPSPSAPRTARPTGPPTVQVEVDADGGDADERSAGRNDDSAGTGAR